MPSTLCCVPKCSNRGGHVFPKEANLRRKWIVAIRRIQWEPNKYSLVCSEHFTCNDYISATTLGTCPLVKRLKGASVPSVFSWTKPVEVSTVNRQHRAVMRTYRKNITDSPILLLSNKDNILVEDIGAEVELVSEDVPDPMECDIILETEICDTSVQTDSYSYFSVERLKQDNKKMLNYSGCESYDRFLMILHSLGPAAYRLNYYYHDVRNVSIENQLLLTLVKLRMNWTNFVLADMFEISETTVSNIFITWVNFMYHQWKEIQIWPSRDLVRYFAPSDFQRKFPKTRVIIDGTECPVKKPTLPSKQHFRHIKIETQLRFLLVLPLVD
ncbi:hypothetical protein SNE40_022386 [Patella caerulea]|uniref:THAP-type domain-containing protein n=1 Tax=Patella caerulea TaxID=87958 RepID=A0AAN8FWJ6_PATCE